MTTLDTAFSWLQAGFSILPIMARGKRPSFDALAATGHDGWSVFKERQATEAEIGVWFGGLQRNIGVVTGYADLVVIDFDSSDAYTWWHAWARIMGKEIETYQVRSARGTHVYFICDEPITSYKVGPVDIKAQYGYVLIPPSIHPSGWIYQASGEIVQRIERLAEVWPITSDELPAVIGDQTHTIDPYAAASAATARAHVGVGMGVVDRIKAAVRPEDLLGLARARRPSPICCPLHADTHPSFYIYPDGGWKCFGCGRYGDVLQLYAELHGVTNTEAIVALAGIL